MKTFRELVLISEEKAKLQATISYLEEHDITGLYLNEYHYSLNRLVELELSSE